MRKASRRTKQWSSLPRNDSGTVSSQPSVPQRIRHATWTTVWHPPSMPRDDAGISRQVPSCLDSKPSLSTISHNWKPNSNRISASLRLCWSRSMVKRTSRCPIKDIWLKWRHCRRDKMCCRLPMKWKRISVGRDACRRVIGIMSEPYTPRAFRHIP